MRVRDLLEALEDCDPDAAVYLMTQPSWPFEVGIAKIIRREEFQGCDDEGDSDSDPDVRGSDVFIVEGTQVRYGSKAAW